MPIVSFNVPTVRDVQASEVVTAALSDAEGVSRVSANIPARLVQAEYDRDRTNPEELKVLIERSGHRVQRYSDGFR
ncbi:MAG: heavy-metal-associated domain-containing protein [Chloroflexia bacterium]